MSKKEALPLNGIDISILFISYNRSDLLELSYRAIKNRMDFGNLNVEFIVSDDASNAAHLARIRALPFDKFVLADTNRGLGSNQNKGLLACDGDFILQIQDDFEFIGDSKLIITALDILGANPDVGTIQLTTQTPDVPHEVRHLPDDTRFLVYVNDRIPELRNTGTRPYSDCPHLKRRQFWQDIGPYRSGSMCRMELIYQMQVACQARWRVASIELASSFRHLGAARSFNPSVLRARRIERLEHLVILGPLLQLARTIARRLRDQLRGSGA